MNIRLANESDIPALSRLLAQLFAQEAEFTPARATQERGLRMIIEQPEIGEILVAEKDHRIGGMVSLLYSVSTALGARVALLEDMVVDSGYRDGGLGTRLLEAAIDLARQRDCRRITLLTDTDNVNAQRFYARQGFVASAMLPMRLLSASDAP